MNNIKSAVIILVSLLFTGSVFAQEARGPEVQTKEEARKEALEKPIKLMVQWMKDNLHLSEQQEKELLDFYLNTPIYFRTIDGEVIDPRKDESMANQEAKLKEVLTSEQLEEFLRRKDEVQKIIMQNVPGK